MEELLEILDKQGRKTGRTKERNQVHKEGDWHASAHIWFINSNQEILLQQRSEKKKLFPLMWCAPVSGHIDQGKDPVNTAVTEAKEELNLEITEDDLDLIAIIRGTYDNDQFGIHEHEYINIFVSTIEIKDIDIQNEEVKGFKWFSKDELKGLIDSKSETMVPAWEEYEAVLSYMKYNL